MKVFKPGTYVKYKGKDIRIVVGPHISGDGTLTGYHYKIRKPEDNLQAEFEVVHSDDLEVFEELYKDGKSGEQELK